jgi:RNA polymerase sigma-70 factor (ECF subfamily)
LEVAIIRLTAAIGFPGIKLKTAKTREVASANCVAFGGVDALSVIYDRHAEALYRLLVAMLGRADDAEDALQEVFVKLATKSFPHVDDLRPYLFRMTRNEAINILRRRKRENRLMQNYGEEIETDSSFNGDKFSAANHNWQKLLARLPLEQREIIALKIWEEMTFAEIAAVVKTSPNTAASRYRYGIERLRKWYAEENVDE